MVESTLLYAGAITLKTLALEKISRGMIDRLGYQGKNMRRRDTVSRKGAV